MKKKGLLAVLFTALMISSAPLSFTSEAPIAKATGKKPVTGLVTQIKQLMPFLKGAHEFGKIFLDLFGLKKMGKALDDLIDASIAFAKEAERKEGPRFDELEKHFAKMQAATEPILEDLQKVVQTTVRPLQWFSPLVTGPLKLVGRKTVKRTVTETDEAGNKVKKVVEIPIDQVVKELPELITEKIFKLVQIYNNAVGKILNAMKATREQIKTGVEEVKKIGEQGKEILKQSPEKVEKLLEGAKRALEKEVLSLPAIAE